MAVSGSLLLMRDFTTWKNLGECRPDAIFRQLRGAWRCQYFPLKHKRTGFVSQKKFVLRCQSSMLPVKSNSISVAKAVCATLTSFDMAIHVKPVLHRLVPAVGIIAFSAWGLPALLRFCRSIYLHNESGWKQSSTYFAMTSYFQPLFAWIGAALICRALDPINLGTEASEILKLRLLNFVRSLSTMLVFAYCMSRIIEQSQQYFAKSNEPDDLKKMGFNFAGKAVHVAIWVAAGSLFMELIGFSTQKWVTAGGLGTVLLTLSGREIFMNFLSSIIIHATRPFGVKQRIQTKISGYDVSGSVERVGWWSPTVIRGDDREAIHIPNSKLTTTVVRNLSQRSHYRIKTNFSISHLDASKIHSILSDMQKVLAKNPEVEQRRLHRRVFLENINPENQALVIMVSCFVKTSHYDEYLCVKEAILLDLLKVINHHQARLATPIWSIQRMSANARMENVPFGENSNTRADSPSEHPFLVIESAEIANADDSTIRPNSAHKVQEPRTTAMDNDSKKSSDGSNVKRAVKPDSSDFQQHDNVDITKRKPKSTTLSVSDDSVVVTVSGPGVGEGQFDTTKPQSASTPKKRASLDDNLVLGVVLDGSKRTLLIDEDKLPNTSVPRNPGEVASSSKDNRDGKVPLTRDL